MRRAGEGGQAPLPHDGQSGDADGEGADDLQRRRLRQATAEVFDSWTAAAAERLRAAGAPSERADELATSLVAAVEGGFMLSRAARSPEPMRSVGRLMRQLVEATLATAAPAPVQPG